MHLESHVIRVFSGLLTNIPLLTMTVVGQIGTRGRRKQHQSTIQSAPPSQAIDRLDRFLKPLSVDPTHINSHIILDQWWGASCWIAVVHSDLENASCWTEAFLTPLTNWKMWYSKWSMHDSWSLWTVSIFINVYWKALAARYVLARSVFLSGFVVSWLDVIDSCPETSWRLRLHLPSPSQLSLSI